MEKMDSKFNIDSKISADAMHQGTVNLNTNVTNVNPLFKDQKRVIKKMIVMDTSKLKGLGIESTIKNAMSKLGKEKLKMSVKPTSERVNTQPTHASPKFIETVIKAELEPKIEPVDPTDTILKHVYRPTVPSPQTPVSSSNEHRNMHAESSQPVRPSPPAAASTNKIVFRMVKTTTSSAPVKPALGTHLRATSIHKIRPTIIASTSSVPVVKPQHNEAIQSDSTSKIVQSQPANSSTSTPLIKSESTLASDGKKIKILSDVSLNDAKTKILEIDKLSSKNLKFTNVIKGTDKSLPKSKIHTNPVPGFNPLHGRPVPSEIEANRPSNAQIPNVFKGTAVGRPTVCASNAVRHPTYPSSATSKIFHFETKAAAKIADAATINDGTVKSTFHAQPISATKPVQSSMPASGFASKDSRFPSPKILNYSIGTEVCTPKCVSVKPVHTATKSSVSEKVASKTPTSHNATKPSVCFTSPISKMPSTSPSVATKIGINETKQRESSSTNYRETKQFPSPNLPPKITKTVTSKCSTSAATEVSTKQLVTTDENFEIIIPSKEKYLVRDKSGMVDRTPICDPTKSFQDAIWTTNNPRTYARHNVKRLLNDKIIKKPRLSGTKAENEQTTELVLPVETAKMDDKCESVVDESPVHCEVVANESSTPCEAVVDVSPVDCDSKLMLPEATSICDQSAADSETPNKSTNARENDFLGFTVEDVNAIASVLSQISEIISRKRAKEAPKTISCQSKHRNNEHDVQCDNWILDHETGVLERKVDQTTSSTNKLLPVDESHSTKSVASTTTVPVADDQLQSTFDDSSTLSKIPVIEDADDEISDADLINRSKSKCIGSAATPSVKHRRAILKSIEIHRRAFMTATTDDDESELSLGVRPQRPKLRKSRQKQTVEQLKIQQNAHVSLLKRFTQTDADYGNLNDEALTYFIDGMEERIEVLENQVRCCFSEQNRDLNVQSVDLSDQSVSVVTATAEDESMKPNEKPTGNVQLVKENESSSSVNITEKCVATSEPITQLPNVSNVIGIADNQQGHSTTHEITIEKDTFLVTEYNECDRINHLPLNVKQERDTSPKPTSSIKRSPPKTKKKSIARKKRKRKSLVEMLAQHVDKDTLKSVLIAHAKQKCDFSSSVSDSSDDDESDVESKIFRTVCTIDLCDDDDETLHEDVLQYLKGDEENEIDTLQHPVPSGSICDANLRSIDREKTTVSDRILLSGEVKKEVKEKSVSKVAETVPIINTTDESSKENAHCLTGVTSQSQNVVSTSTKEGELEVKTADISDATLVDSLDAKHLSSPQDTCMEIEPSCLESFNRIGTIDVEMLDASNEVEVKSDVSEVNVQIETALSEKIIGTEVDNVSKLGENIATVGADVRKSDDINFVAKEPDAVEKPLKPIEHTTDDVPKFDVISCTKDAVKPVKDISSLVKLKKENKQKVAEPVTERKKLSFDETLADVDSANCNKTNKKSKRKSSLPKSSAVSIIENKKSENSIDSSQRVDITSDKKTANETIEKTTPNQMRFSSVSVNDNSAVGGLKIKIKIEKDPKEDCNPIPVPSNDTVNGIPKSSRSRKRKNHVLEVSSTSTTSTPVESEATTRKRPIFDNFDSPEILTTKRARKSKSYADDEIRNEDLSSKSPHQFNQRLSNRRSISSKNSTEATTPTNVRKNVKKVEEQQNTPKIEPPKAVDESIVKQTEAKVKPTTKGQREIAPLISTAKQYVCGNCNEAVAERSWSKHERIHYGLAWRVDVDPPLDMDNIHSMASKVLNYTKKANIRYLKCQKCNVEKKSALGYMSHVEVCGLTPEEIKSKLVKCEYCPSLIRSCSMKPHLTFCAGLKRVLQKEKEAQQEESEVEIPAESFNDTGRVVRRSAQKARSSFKELDKPPETKIEDYVERVRKTTNKQLWKWRQLLKENKSIECVRIGCEFSSNDIPSMVNHFNSCVLIDGETFYCNRCDHGPNIRTVIEEHIKSNHSIGVIESIDDKDFSESDDDAELGEESSESEGSSGVDENSEVDDGEMDYDDEDDDGWNTKGYKQKKKRDGSHHSEAMLNNCLDRKVLFDHSQLLKSYSGGNYFPLTLEWTQDFRDKHFSTKDLWPSATPNKFSVLSSTMTDLYTPKISTSNRFFVKEVRKYRKSYGSTAVSKSDNWKSLNRFEATKDNDSLVLFTGGPVLSMAWVPVPDDHLSQLLAVCCRNDADEDILLCDTKPVKCLIQIWNFNKLKNGQMRHAPVPHLLYGIAYDHGPVIQMEFCPSGGFTEDRLGLLAVSSFDGHVDVLALPKNVTSDNSKIENLVFRIEPSLTLCCELDQPLGVLLTKLVWSQSRGHTKLAGGYSNGMVAIWNLKNLGTPNICRYANDTPTLLPTDLFFAGNKTIKLLEFHHDEKNEARWLIAGTHDRKVKFFDTHNVHLEISTTVAHSRIVAGCWPLHWSTFMLGIDNAYCLKVSGILVKQPLDIGCRASTFYSCIGSTCDISFNNWLNTYVFVTSYGDVHVGYVRQMVSGFCEMKRQKSILSYTDCVNIDQSNAGDDVAVDDEGVNVAVDEQQPSTSSVCAEQSIDISYPSTDGIIFCDFETPLPAVTSPSYEKIGQPPMNTYNMVKVNRIVFNPNASAYKLYALGYECGFVRINQLLPK